LQRREEISNMSVGNIPSGSDGFKFPGWGRVGGGALITLTTGGTLTHYHSTDVHQRLTREHTRNKSLKLQTLTPKQFIMQSAQDGCSAFQVKQSLVASDIKHKGLDFSNLNSFDIEELYVPSSNRFKQMLRQQDRILQLKQYEKKKRLFGLRGGASTAESEAGVEEVLLEEGSELEAEEYGYSPNISYEISEQTLQDPREVVHSFTTTGPLQTPSIVFYVIAFFLTVGGSLLFDYAKGRLSKWTASKNSQESCSTLGEAVSVEEVKRLQGEGKGLDTDKGPVERATPEFLLEALKSCKSKAITNKEAVYLLVRYYGLSEEEASQLVS
jgi:hypothetical protein